MSRPTRSAGVVRGRAAALGGFAVLLASCQPAAPPPGPDPATLQAALQEHAERLLWIHYRLDSALNEIQQAEAKAGEGNASAAGYHAAEAYRFVLAADDALLEQGQGLQREFNLDAATINRY
ncbi:MAG: hypothetical protein EHM68_16015 [Lysobacterales bacterium]|nr:MAG: hypothetical protein EHM68_16015 [Xanthomonadales bacterium]